MSHHYSGPDWGFPGGDARLDLTDLYAFPKPDDSRTSILIMNVRPSVGANPRGPTTTEPFAPEALYELKIDTNGDAVADRAYRVRFSSSGDGTQTATLLRVEGVHAAGTDEYGQIIFRGAPVSTRREPKVTEAGDYRFFAGWRSDPFFFDRTGALNNLLFKQLFDLVAQRNYFFTYDGKQYGPLLNVEKAVAVYTRGSRFLEGTPIPPSFDHQAPYLDFWLRLIGVRDLRSVIVDNAWNRNHQESELSLVKGKATLERLVQWFLTSAAPCNTCDLGIGATALCSLGKDR